MSQTAERLIDKLKIDIFNVDEWGMVQLSLTDAKAIGAQLRLMALADGSEKRLIDKLQIAIFNVDELELTPIEVAIYRMLVGTDGPVSFQRLVAASNCKSLGSLWVHTRRLRLKLKAHRAGHIETVRSEGYRFVAEGGRE